MESKIYQEWISWNLEILKEISFNFKGFLQPSHNSKQKKISLTRVLDVALEEILFFWTWQLQEVTNFVKIKNSYKTTSNKIIFFHVFL